MKLYKTNFFNIAKETLIVLAAVTALYLPLSSVSCRATADSIKILDGDFTSPELYDFSPTGSRALELRFSEAVTVENIHVTDESTGTIIWDIVRTVTEDQAVVRLELAEPTLLGVPYRVSGLVIDKAENSLDFSIAFSGYNDSVPRLVLSEVRSEATKPRYEFIELYALSDGNLAGVTLFSANDGDDCIYEFPPAEVKKGEYIVVHYRKMPADGQTPAMFVDETGGNLNASTGNESISGSRDFWANNIKARLAKSDVILLRERAGGKLFDALLYCEPAKTAWKNDAISKSAQEAFDSGLWPDGLEPASALSSDGVTATRTISRQNIRALISSPGAEEFGKQIWLVTKTSSATPGAENSSAPYVPTPKK